MGKVLCAPGRLRCAIAIVALFALPLAPLGAEAAKGKIIAKRWCAACHLVSSDQKSASPDVPSFAAVARKKTPPGQLKAFLADPHPKMPDMNLTRSEIEDIAAYIRSLER
ncbi:MAG: cytochrome c [Beijerinckiaceae bacterium]|nr:cytochrome c [Beijerinckiaceae bacterium]